MEDTKLIDDVKTCIATPTPQNIQYIPAGLDEAEHWWPWYVNQMGS